VQANELSTGVQLETSLETEGSQIPAFGGIINLHSCPLPIEPAADSDSVDESRSQEAIKNDPAGNERISMQSTLFPENPGRYKYT
jgi:hypothetical protein